MFEAFRLTERHYNIILKQGLENLPQESGGFLGGHEGLIKAIHPLFNAHLYDKTGSFSFTPEDVDRAHRFFDKHGLDYYGLYHTHPKGAAYPSDADINTGHKYHFILSFQDPKKPVFNAYYIDGRQPIFIPIHIVSDIGSSPIDIHSTSKTLKKPASRTSEEEADKLAQRIESIKNESPMTYPVLPPHHNNMDSDFSTLA